ncbi:MAG: SDR family oxidoreductase [SAR202 cluster bacterium]|nr:short-chain dehydrogenase [Chloroflexota bacterium]MQG34590.1 SDR family oxidoreductase [SAR202 cluster bacterium]HCP23090.1 short-chain dehydrogenase [Dehalococcoidia bacterium]|tara:strand:+ start:2444 stop:3262 length:819 start_codon:yes stop_codon:yes gene_type:complete
MGKFDGKVALVTGAGRMRGIGRYAALAFAKEGAAVTVTGTGRDPSAFPEDEQAAGWRDVESVAQEITGSLAGKALPMTLDVTDAAQVQEAVAKTVAEFGRVDYLVNNASASRMAAWEAFEDLTPEQWRHVMDVKVTGAFLCTQAVTRELLRRESGGSIVNVISVEAKISRATDLAYATASGALYTFTQKAGRALAPHGIRVNGISPGTTDTARNDNLYGYPRSKDWDDRLQSIPLGRAGTPEEMGNFAAWLCSKEAEFIVGQCIEIDGGQAA